MIIKDTSIIDKIFDMCWYEADDDESDDQFEKEIVLNGEKSLKNILVFIHNSCV